MTNDQINKLAALAVAVSSAAPLQLRQPGYQCYIPHDLIRQIRAELEAGRYDWRTQHRANKGKAHD